MRDRLAELLLAGLLLLNAISLHEWQSICQLTLDQDLILVKLVTSESQHLLNYLVYV